MTTETLTLSAWLLERIAAWEKVAERAGSFTPWDEDFQNDNYGHLTVQPSVILAVCKAHRAIVEDLAELVDYDRDKFIVSPDVLAVAWRTLRALASVYADAPGYREEWAG